MLIRYSLVLAALGLLLGNCSPKTAESASAESPAARQAPVSAATAPDEELSPCPKFTDAPFPDQTETNYVLYRDFLRANDWDKAYELWQQVYEVAPAADGRRNTVMADGIRFYEHFMAQSEDPEQREEYINRIFDIYDQIANCYPEGGYIAGRKAFDYYYKYKGRKTDMEIYQLFKESIDVGGLETPDFVLNPFTSLLVDLYFNDQISREEAHEYQEKVRDILANGLEECEGRACERWEIISEYAPNRLEAFETIRGFYDCEYYVDQYFPDFEAAPTDCDVIRTVYSRLKWGGCSEDHEHFQQLVAAGNEHCRVEAGSSVIARQAYECLRNADYQCAIDGFTEASNSTDDNERKATYLMLVAKIYQTHLKNFPQSRQFALQAAEVRPDWGEPYIHIGRLYASSGPLCGPGRGWDSQVVVWPAIDMWNRAKSVDPSVAAEANQWINQYAQYMPDRSEIFQRTLQEGDSFRVECWIQETTRIRAAP